MKADEKALDKATTILVKALQNELVRQGHVLTSKLLREMRREVRREGVNLISEVYMQDYAKHVDKGVKARNIPYSGRTGAGGTSKYIQGLIRFWQLRGLDNKQAKSAAFATAAKHKKEGMPTKASSRFSKSGKRTGFIEQSIIKSKQDFKKQLGKTFKQYVQVQVRNAFQPYQNTTLTL